jgi:Ca2+-binding EF-hand superfamily protein
MASLATATAHAQPNPPSAASSPLGRNQFVAQMDAEFRKMDGDRNGLVSRTEIEQYQQLQVATRAQIRNQQQFAELDSDRNGQLSKAEFAKLVAPPPAANAGPMLSRMDGNRDQQISLAEHRAATLANFDRLDANRDGNVSDAEMKAGGITPR